MSVVIILPKINGINIGGNRRQKMSFFGDLNKELQKELIKFVEDSKNNKEQKPLKLHLVESLLEDIVNGDREITGLASDWGNGDVFVRFSFTESIREEYIKNREKTKEKN